MFAHECAADWPAKQTEAPEKPTKADMPSGCGVAPLEAGFMFLNILFMALKCLLILYEAWRGFYMISTRILCKKKRFFFVLQDLCQADLLLFYTQ